MATRAADDNVTAPWTNKIGGPLRPPPRSTEPPRPLQPPHKALLLLPLGTFLRRPYAEGTEEFTSPSSRRANLGALGYAPITRTGSPTNKQAVAFVTEVLLNIGPGVTRLSPSCYADSLEYLHHGDKAGNLGCARPQ